ncbi:MAG: hypothetical protein ABFS16_02590 [Bacteroidota bacterium]
MKKILLFISLTLFGITSFSQIYDIGLGYTSSSILYGDLGYIAANNFGFYLELGTEVPEGVKSQNDNGNVNWEEIPEDQISTDFYYTVYNFAAGYKLNSFFLGGILGFAPKTTYQSYNENIQFGNDGTLYKTASTNEAKFNAGIKAKYFYPLGGNNVFVSLGLKATIIEGLGVALGVSF